MQQGGNSTAHTKEAAMLSQSLGLAVKTQPLRKLEKIEKKKKKQNGFMHFLHNAPM